MEFGLLGTLEVRAGGGPLALGAPKQRALLAFLLLHANHVVARERLIDALWGDDPPESAPKSVQVYVSRLRKLLPAGMLVTRPPGYVLEVEPDTLDLGRFERLVAEAHGAEPVRAATLLREALGLWRGPPLAELWDEPFARREAERLEEIRLAALEQRIDADLALGRHEPLIAELETLVAEHPHRERLRGQLMLALYRSGRQADALQAYRDARAALDELGLEPGAALRQLERRILAQEPALEPARMPAPLPGPLVPASPFPFVGRAEELAALRSLLERTEGGEGGLVLLAGEAGGGKTRLIRELAHEARARDMLVCYGASDAAVSVPYEPLREWLEFLLRVCDPDALTESLGERSELLARLVPELARLTGTPAPASADAESDRYLLQSAAVELLSRLSRLRPLLLVADDVHWADGETLQLIRRLARAAPEARLLVLAAYRSEEIGPLLAGTLAELARLDWATRLSVGELSEDEVLTFIRESTAAEATTAFVSAMHELTGGMPLLLCELWRDARERGVVEVSDGGVSLSGPAAELRGPERIREIVQQRLSRVVPETAALVELAAVAGPRFELRILADAAELDRTALAAAVEEAVGIGMVEELPGPAPECRFTHELVRRAVYDRVAGIRRAELHLRIGEALERAYAADPTRVLPDLAHHFTLAASVDGVERAVDYNLRAGDAAIAAATFAEGAARLTTALELGIDEPRDRARTQVELAHLLQQMGRHAEADVMVAEGLAAATDLEERGIAASALLYRMGHRFGDSALDVEEMRRVGEAAVETLRQLGKSRDLAITGRYLGLALQRLGRTGESVPVLERALEDAEEAGDWSVRRRVVGTLAHSLVLGPTPVVEAIGRCEALLQSSASDGALTAIISRFLSVFYAMAGRSKEASDLLRSSSAVLDELRHETSVWVYRRAAAEARELIGDNAGAERELKAKWQSFVDFGEQTVDERAMASAYQLAFLYCDHGRWDDAVDCLLYGCDIPLAFPTSAAVFRLAVGARLAARDGRDADALALAGRAVACAELGDNLNLRARAWLALAEVQRARGAAAEAGAAVEEAVRLYESKGNVAAIARLFAIDERPR
jgi:DNA-binding SARP family transcriptional activator